MPVARRRQQGLVLVLVLIFALLLTSSVATFMRRAVVDSAIARQRNAAAQAEALARGGVQLAYALLLEDRLREQAGEFRSDTLHDPWARVGEVELVEGDATLRLRVRDAGARLNLNALLESEGQAGEHAAILLEEFFTKVVAEIPGSDDEKNYDPAELARNLLDYIDADETSPRGDLEDDYYQKLEPAYRAANRPLLSVEELGLVRGFDPKLVRAVEPYVTVFPYAGVGGVNPNTAPPWVLALLYSQDALDAGSSRLPPADRVQQLLDVRAEGGLFCDETSFDPDRGLECTGLGDILPGQVFPAPSYQSDVFHVDAEAQVGDVKRVVSVVIDRSTPSEPPLLLSWRVR